MTLPLENKVAVITGGNSGVGFGIAQEFIAQGATVVITGRNQETLDRSVEQLGSNSSAMRADASKDGTIAGLSVEDWHGRPCKPTTTSAPEFESLFASGRSPTTSAGCARSMPGARTRGKPPRVAAR